MATAPSQENIRVLLVSSDRAIRDALFAFPAGIEVRLAADGREAWGVMREWTPTVVVVDLQSGSSGGFALSRDLKDDPRLARVPVLLLLQRPHDAWLAKQAGANSYLTKPINTDDLADAALALVAD